MLERFKKFFFFLFEELKIYADLTEIFYVNIAALFCLFKYSPLSFK
jgi:hypothetical protein